MRYVDGYVLPVPKKHHRDRFNAKVMKDPRLAKMMEATAMSFEPKRMIYGGFKVLADL